MWWYDQSKHSKPNGWLLDPWFCTNLHAANTMNSSFFSAIVHAMNYVIFRLTKDKVWEIATVKFWPLFSNSGIWSLFCAWVPVILSTDTAQQRDFPHLPWLIGIMIASLSRAFLAKPVRAILLQNQVQIISLSNGQILFLQLDFLNSEIKSSST